MFDVGFAELFLLGLVGLIVLGPERLPAVARTLGGLMRKARASWASLRSTIEAELAEADITKPLKEVGDEIRQVGKSLKPNLPDISSYLNPESKSPDDPEKALESDNPEKTLESDNPIENLNSDDKTDADAETESADESDNSRHTSPNP